MSNTDATQIALFEHLDEASRERVLQLAQACEFVQGEAIFHEGDEGDAFYLITEGEVVIEKALGDAEAVKVLARLQPGAFFGELALVSDAKRSAAARAAGPVRLLRIRREDFRRTLDADPRLASSLLLSLLLVTGERLRTTSIELTLLYEVSQMLAAAERAEVFSGVLSRLREILRAQGAMLILRNPYTEAYEAAAHCGNPGPLFHRLPSASLPPFAASAWDKPRGSRDPAADLGDGERAAALAVPIRAAGGTCGILLLTGGGLELSARTEVLAETVGTQIGQALERLRRAEEERGRDHLQRRYVDPFG